MKRAAFVITLVSSLALLSAAAPVEQNTSSGQDISDVQTLATIEPHADFVTLSSDQTLLFAAYSKKKGYNSLNEGWLKVWRLDSSPLMLVWEWKLVGYRINQMAVAPDGQTLAAVCSDAKIRLWDAQTSKFRRAIKASTDEARNLNVPALAATYSAVAYSADGQTLAIAGGVYRHANHDPQDPNVQSMIQLLDARTLTPRHSFFILGIPATMCFAPDSKHIASWCRIEIENQVFGQRGWGVGGYTAIWDAKTGEQATSFQEQTYDQISNAALSFSPDGSALLVSKSDGAFIWNVNDGSLKVRLKGGMSWRGGMTFSADGKLAAMGSGYSIAIYDAQIGARQQVLPSKGYIIFVEFAPDKTHLISVDYQGAVRSWRIK